MGHLTNSTPSRLRQPELEAEFNRSPSLGYEPTAEVGFIRCLEHGYPTPLARWHCHEEYEFHIITATSGKTFVGDWIGPFEPGHVVLCGPRLPHNWISLDVPPEGVEKRDLVIQFRHAPIEKACQAITELMMQAAGPQAQPFVAVDGGQVDAYVSRLSPRYFNYRKTSIYAGSNEIQRNIIAKMTLGL